TDGARWFEHNSSTLSPLEPVRPVRAGCTLRSCGRPGGALMSFSARSRTDVAETLAHPPNAPPATRLSRHELCGLSPRCSQAGRDDGALLVGGRRVHLGLRPRPSHRPRRVGEGRELYGGGSAARTPRGRTSPQG